MPNREEFCIVFPVYFWPPTFETRSWRKRWILYIWLPPLHKVAKRSLLSRSTFTIQVIPLEKLIHICSLRWHTCTYLKAIKTERLSRKPKLNFTTCLRLITRPPLLSKERDRNCKNQNQANVYKLLKIKSQLWSTHNQLLVVPVPEHI